MFVINDKSFTTGSVLVNPKKTWGARFWQKFLKLSHPNLGPKLPYWSCNSSGHQHPHHLHQYTVIEIIDSSFGPPDSDVIAGFHRLMAGITYRILPNKRAGAFARADLTTWSGSSHFKLSNGGFGSKIGQILREIRSF